MKHLILNNGKFLKKSFSIMGMIIPQFSNSLEAQQFNSINDAQLELNKIPNGNRDMRIVLDLNSI